MRNPFRIAGALAAAAFLSAAGGTAWSQIIITNLAAPDDGIVELAKGPDCECMTGDCIFTEEDLTVRLRVFANGGVRSVDYDPDQFGVFDINAAQIIKSTDNRGWNVPVTYGASRSVEPGQTVQFAQTVRVVQDSNGADLFFTVNWTLHCDNAARSAATSGVVVSDAKGQVSSEEGFTEHTEAELNARPAPAGEVSTAGSVGAFLVSNTKRLLAEAEVVQTGLRLFIPTRT